MFSKKECLTEYLWHGMERKYDKEGIVGYCGNTGLVISSIKGH